MAKKHSVEEAIADFTAVIVTGPRANADILDQIGRIIQEEAQRVIGTYEYGWTPLQPATIQAKGQDTPLLTTGMLRDSIMYTVLEQTMEVAIGSDDPVAAYQELGTVTIPARSFLMGAMMAKERDVFELAGAGYFARIKNGLGIDG